MTKQTETAAKTAEVKKFIPGTVYSVRSTCNHNCIFRFLCVSRSASGKTLTFSEVNEAGKPGNREFKKRPEIWREAEMVYPLGKYSMAPILTAEDNRKQEKTKDEPRIRVNPVSPVSGNRPVMLPVSGTAAGY